MKAETLKKVWSQPKLIVIGEGTPEENVLDGCKGNGLFGTGPSSSHSNCNKSEVDGSKSCGACQSNAGGAS